MYTKKELIDKVIPLFSNYPIRRAALFGSYARNEQKEDSDFDIFLEFSEPIGLRYGSLYLDLKEAMPIAVGLMTKAGFEEQSEYFRESALSDMEVFYEK